jgi:hypothetical protein
LNHAALEEILKSERVITEMLDIAEDIIGRTGEDPSDYDVEEWVGRNRARVSIVTATPQARLNEATEHTLLRALGSGIGPTLQVYTSRSGATSLRTQAEIDNYTRNRNG